MRIAISQADASAAPEFIFCSCCCCCFCCCIYIGSWKTPRTGRHRPCAATTERSRDAAPPTTAVWPTGPESSLVSLGGSMSRPKGGVLRPNLLRSAHSPSPAPHAALIPPFDLDHPRPTLGLTARCMYRLDTDLAGLRYLFSHSCRKERPLRPASPRRQPDP